MKDTPDEPEDEIPHIRKNLDGLIKRYSALVEEADLKFLADPRNLFNEELIAQLDELEDELRGYKILRHLMDLPEGMDTDEWLEQMD